MTTQINQHLRGQAETVVKFWELSGNTIAVQIKMTENENGHKSEVMDLSIFYRDTDSIKDLISKLHEEYADYMQRQLEDLRVDVL